MSTKDAPAPARPKVHHIGAALQGIADEHADILTPRQKEALYQAASELWDAPAPAPSGSGVRVKPLEWHTRPDGDLYADCPIGRYDFTFEVPTHWRPLPEPPSALLSAGGEDGHL